MPLEIKNAISLQDFKDRLKTWMDHVIAINGNNM